MNSLPTIPPKAPGAFRILHFSDLHTGLVDWNWRYLLDKRFFGRLNQFVTRQRHLALENIALLGENYQALQADMALCTGDLTSIGSQAEFQHAMDLLKPIRDNAKENFLYVPGNHDAYVPQNRPALEEAFRQLNHERFHLDDLPQTAVIGPVEFILINPARPCAIWLSNGTLSTDVWEKLDYILSLPARARVRMVVTHFPLLDHTGRPLSWRTKFVQTPRLWEHGKEGRFQAVLSGHVHRPFLWAPQQKDFWHVGAGSLTIHNAFSLVDIDGNTGTITPTIIPIQPR